MDRRHKDLYSHYYNERDHVDLRFLLDYLYQGMPGADVILTYDNDDFIEWLYLFPEVEKIGRTYSI